MHRTPRSRGIPRSGTACLDTRSGSTPIDASGPRSVSVIYCDELDSSYGSNNLAALNAVAKVLESPNITLDAHLLKVRCFV